MKQHSKSQPKNKKKKPPLVVKNLIKLSDNDVYYNCNKYYSYNLFIAMIDGGRGIGKTTTFLKKGLINTDKDEEFIYLRRYKTEIKKFVNKDSLSPLIDGVRYDGDGAGGYTASIEDRTLGYIIPLATARSYKSVDFHKVTLIIFDEAFVMQTATYRYLTDEVILFLEFLSTVIRTRTNVKVVLIGNNEDMFSPYHSYFEIPYFKDIYIDYDRGIYCQHAKNNPKLFELEQKTGLYNLIKDTAYGKYHYDNEVINNSLDIDVREKPPFSTLQFRINIDNKTINVYTYKNTKNDVCMYCEYIEKYIRDKISYEIMKGGKFNYLDINMFKKRCKSYLYDFYFNHKISYNDSKGGAVISWVIENT